ncbi:MAG TPA: hypothetical protein VGN10_07935 [Pyrinomonadaceae bacterium]
MIVVIGLIGLVLTIVLVRMIWTKDYSLLFGRNQGRDLSVQVPTPTLPLNNTALDLAVAHFVKETAKWESDAERTDRGKELRDLRMRGQLK